MYHYEVSSIWPLLQNPGRWCVMHGQHAGCSGLFTIKIYHILHINTQCISLFITVGTAFDASFAMLAFLAKGHMVFVFWYICPLPHLAVLLLLVAKSSGGCSPSCIKHFLPKGILKLFFQSIYLTSSIHSHLCPLTITLGICLLPWRNTSAYCTMDISWGV